MAALEPPKPGKSGASSAKWGSVGVSSAVYGKGIKVLGIEAIGAVAFEGAVDLIPEIVAGQRDAALGQRRDLGEERVGNGAPLVMREAVLGWPPVVEAEATVRAGKRGLDAGDAGLSFIGYSLLRPGSKFFNHPAW
ncbi:hypothetical protein GCM10008023_38440 [Sphingomonas glacialis]|uniref:Uncharacterized protein n=1 Tax=Sphingomonas glacialis TaxID=658225 RepID=A0ABQ3LU27_9SPHN|nr:hypothetical protein [Sphingomonas glacialis]GHH25272.1 hypothetical protein GCM10008023_38440 [Sphingomonas glacialis]